MGCACNNHDIKSEKNNEMQENNNSSKESKINNSIQNNYIIIQDSSKINAEVDNINLKNSTLLIQESNTENKKNFTLLQNAKPKNLLNEENIERNNQINNDINENNNQREVTPIPNEIYQEIETDIIPDSEFNEMLIQYPEIGDNVQVERRNPQENKEDKTIYYGEWDINKNVGHRRGIQLCPYGAIYFEYWKNNRANGKGKMYHED